MPCLAHVRSGDGCMVLIDCTHLFTNIIVNGSKIGGWQINLLPVLAKLLINFVFINVLMILEKIILQSKLLGSAGIIILTGCLAVQSLQEVLLGSQW